VWYLEQFLDVKAFKFEILPGCFVEGVVKYQRIDVISDDRRIRRLVLFSFHPEYTVYRTLRLKGIMMKGAWTWLLRSRESMLSWMVRPFRSCGETFMLWYLDVVLP